MSKPEVKVTEKMYDTLVRPVITEKAMKVSENGQVTFQVPLTATKTEVKAAVEALFGVKVKAVNTVRIAGKESVIKCSADTTLLRAMEAAGLNPPSDCRSGRCGWCHSQLLSGKVYVPASVDGRRLADKEFGFIHPCCSFPLSDVTIDVPPAH